MSKEDSGLLLDNKVCVITACESPSRIAIADRFAEEGARLVLTVTTDEAREDAEALTAVPRDRLSIELLDVTSVESWNRLAQSVESRFGGVHVLVQGLSRGYVKGIPDTSLELYRQTNAVNMEGCFLGLKALSPLMQQSGGGSIIQLSSIYAKNGRADAAAFCAGSGGLMMMTKAAALEFAKQENPVRVNALLLGGIDEGAVSDVVIDFASQEHLGAPPPIGTFGHFADMSEAALFLASDDSKYVTGLVLPVDGGQLAV